MPQTRQALEWWGAHLCRWKCGCRLRTSRTPSTATAAATPVLTAMPTQLLYTCQDRPNAISTDTIKMNAWSNLQQQHVSGRKSVTADVCGVWFGAPETHAAAAKVAQTLCW